MGTRGTAARGICIAGVRARGSPLLPSQTPGLGAVGLGVLSCPPPFSAFLFSSAVFWVPYRHVA